MRRGLASAAAGPLPAAPGELEEVIQERKAAVLTAVAESRRAGRDGRAEVFRAARALEETAAGQKSPDFGERVEGRWSLVYSAQELGGTAGLGDADGVIDRLTAQAYRFFFKFAPALAGAQGGGGEPTYAQWGAPRNEQTVNVSAGTVRNVVEVPLPGNSAAPWRVQIVVEGEAMPGPGGDASDLEIIFTRFSASVTGKSVPRWLPSLPAFPLPRPRGRLRTTFVDADFRVSRGGRGGIFVLRRLGLP